MPIRCRRGAADEFITKARTRAGVNGSNETASPSYVEVSATPSATLSVKQAGETVARANWGTIVSKGSAAGPRTRIELIDQGKNWVNVSVVDEDTGQPVPCRIHFRSLDGVPYQPHGFHNHINSNLDTCTRTWAATCAWGRSRTPTSTARAKGGCREAR